MVVPLLFVALAVTLSVVMARIVSHDEERIARFTHKPEEVKPEIPKEIISRYDSIFREVGGKHDVDWVLLAAIASAESRFKPDAVSRSGATGLMQVMPSVSRAYGYTREQMFDPYMCTELAAELLHKLNDQFRFPEGFNGTERLHFILAAYNAGYSRIAGARRLAQKHGASASQWSEVEGYLKMLSRPEAARSVKSRTFHGSRETIGYVRKVMRLYRSYHERVAKAEKLKTENGERKTEN